ncbi:MAG TPA: hypothetical protein VM802_21620 [Chitinophaga sp.]|uniref:toxin-antitoxin system YwqK family antitoxin n=1 Tax=Chitinophaga sp. TaxID=1869181 RepID=UPI002B999732|nr:hypothetical protein [Chitinophaga sp.]HVI47486.1 hypothetical protein [Chitinophaga sp.]
MQQLFLCILLQLLVVTGICQVKNNQRDAQRRKQGHWIEEVGEVRGEPGYVWEGNYRNDRKDGVWKKTSPMGTVLAEETFKNNVLDGYCTYYYPNGKRSEEGTYITTEIAGQRDTIMVIDPVTNVETPTEIVRLGNSVRHGVWKLYDEETGKMVKEYYNRGDVISAADYGDTTAVAPKAPAQPGGMKLPHEAAGKHNRKKE